jgi:carboxypeptidase C (cathepsin A)
MLDGLTRAYGGAFAAYARDELGFRTEMTYILLSSDISGKWDWGEHSGRASAGAGDDLRELLSLVPSFRLMVAHGYSDMVTPYAVSRHARSSAADRRSSRAQLRPYRGAYMFYIDAESRRVLALTPGRSINRRSDDHPLKSQDVEPAWRSIR